VYLSPRDKFAGAGLGGVCKDAAAQQAYNAIYRQQLTEVLTRYGQMVEVWFDGSSGVPTADLVEKYAAHAALFQGPQATIRWVGNEMGFAPYPLWNAESKADQHGGVSTSMHGTPDGDAWVPVECDVSIRRPNWFWSTTNEKHLMTLDQLIEVYYRSVGRGAQLLLNIPPDRTGHMAAADFARAKEFGEELRRRFGKSVAETAGRGERLELPLFKNDEGDKADHVILEEDCRYGQRVRAFRLEGRVKGKWKALYDGSSIGHKRILPIEAATYETLRLRLMVEQGEPRIRRFAAFHAGVAAPASWDASPKVWADDAVGDWTGGSFEIDLTKKITDATSYRLRFVARGGQVRGLAGVELLLDGAPAAHLVRSGGPDAVILTMTALNQKVVLRGRVEGADQGAILLKRLN
jgi:alpha-L-fucosidase